MLKCHQLCDLAKLLTLSVPQFPLLLHGYSTSSYLRGLLWKVRVPESIRVTSPGE